MDSVYSYAVALDKLLKEECPNASHSAARECITGPLLLKYLHQITFQGVTGHIAFDNKGDNLYGQYAIKHITKEIGGYKTEIIGVWSHDTNQVTLDVNKMHFYVDFDNDTGIPVSVCSLSCPASHYYVNGDEPCCWQCYPCRENEIVAPNKTFCFSCPEYHWPTPDGASCEMLVPRYLSWSDMSGWVLMLVASICFITSLVNMGIFFTNIHRTVSIVA